MGHAQSRRAQSRAPDSEIRSAETIRLIARHAARSFVAVILPVRLKAVIHRGKVFRSLPRRPEKIVMTQADLTLFHFPAACSQVAVFALEHAGLAYRLELINLAAGAQSQPGYLVQSPLGKVPLLLIDGEPLTENAAILTYIAALRPDAGLFPVSDSPRMKGEIVGGMSFCGGTLHPTVRGIANPARITTGAVAPVHERSTELAVKAFGHAERRLGERGWWLGEWSIIDVYLNWAFSVARYAGFDTTALPFLSSLKYRLAVYPAYARMMAIDTEARATLGH